MKKADSAENKEYLGLMGAWALAFGCSVGWGAFVMPGTTFLPIAGPVGTAIGLGLGWLVMLLLQSYGRMPVMDEHLSKPIEPEKLYETMALLIKKRAQEAEQDAN